MKESQWKPVRTFVFWTSGSALVWAPPLMYWWTQDRTLAVLIFLGFIALSFFARFDDLAELGFGPLKAKMRETIDEASATIEQLRQVACVVARSSLTDIMAGGFMGSMHLSKRLELRDDIVKSLEKIEVGPDQIANVLTDWNRGVCHIFARGIGKIIQSEIPQNRKNEFGKKWNDLGDFSVWQAASPDQIRCIIKDFGYDPSDEVIEALSDYEHFCETSEIRNKNKWAEY